MEFDPSILERVGTAGIALALIYLMYKIGMFMLHLWKESTAALNRNTEAYLKLSNVFENSNQRELEFQEKALLLLEESYKKISDIHKSTVD